MGEDLLFAGLGLAMREAALFAGTGFLLLGTSDLLVDFIWIARTLKRRFTVYRRFERASAATLKPSDRPGRLASFEPAW